MKDKKRIQTLVIEYRQYAREAKDNGLKPVSFDEFSKAFFEILIMRQLGGKR